MTEGDAENIVFGKTIFDLETGRRQVGKILAGFVTTVITVFLTLFAQNWYSKNLEQTKFELKYDTFESRVYFTPEQKALLAKDSNESYAMSIYTIENAGSEPLTDQRVRIETEGNYDNKIIAAGSSIYPGMDKESVKVTLNGRSAFIDYKILNPGETHRLWVIDDGYGLATLTARKPGMKVSSVDKEFSSESIFDDTFLLVIIAVVFTVCVFGFGAGLGWSGFADEIKKRGFSPDEIMKLPAEKALPPKVDP